jgi:hypothetical protein
MPSNGQAGPARVSSGPRRRGGTRGRPQGSKGHSPSDPASAWTATTNKRVQFGYGLNYLLDNEHAIIVDVEPVPARTSDEARSTATMLERTQARDPRSGGHTSRG